MACADAKADLSLCWMHIILLGLLCSGLFFLPTDHLSLRLLEKKSFKLRQLER